MRLLRLVRLVRLMVSLSLSFELEKRLVELSTLVNIEQLFVRLGQNLEDRVGLLRVDEILVGV